eukprot:CAMPEP_0182424892 /NCGR_PEP_ID=MMETSP1167-20130531/11154_1 /TAXON_ID=2988 /ORGANISM="Mallomonas Sp, Strain CCMP3275" /LENGTH=361 /DNA_ID=CAMNT_0024605047 /DNA_START=652 /DNA_END=1738 /DNA_ORIENTATION=+
MVDTSWVETSSTLVIFIGVKDEIVNNISLRLSLSVLLAYRPNTHDLRTIRGEHTRYFQERYGGVSRVKEASVIGILIGSMGLTGELIQTCIARLQRLITAAGKIHYTLVMGRLNESKLANFPEIDIFCLISNEDMALIRPKTFHVPIVTPYELELALGAYDWSSTYYLGTGRPGDISVLNSADMMSKEAMEHTEKELEVRVRAVWCGESVASEEDEPATSTCTETEREAETETERERETKRPLQDRDNSCCGGGDKERVCNQLYSEVPSETIMESNEAAKESDLTSQRSLVAPIETEGQLVVQQSAAVAHFQQRTYQGLKPTVSCDEWHTDIKQGKMGIASSYKPLLADDIKDKLPSAKVL